MFLKGWWGGRTARANIPVERVANLAPLVERAVRTGDAVAVSLLDEAAEALAVTVGAVVRRLALPMQFSLVVSGGTLLGGTHWENAPLRFSTNRLRALTPPL